MKGRFWISATFLLMQAATSQAAETNTMRPRLELRQDVRLEITQLKRLDSDESWSSSSRSSMGLTARSR